MAAAIRELAALTRAKPSRMRYCMETAGEALHHPTSDMTAFTATIELITPTRAVVELHDDAGNWFGGQSFDCRAGSKALYEVGYNLACLSARIHGGMINVYKWG